MDAQFEFEATASSTTLQLNSAISFVSWNLNGRVPGPTCERLRAIASGLFFHNEDGHSHSMHFHGIHPAEMDGVQPVRHGKTTIYEFDAEPYGIHPTTVTSPLSLAISVRGLYGMFIIDPPVVARLRMKWCW